MDEGLIKIASHRLKKAQNILVVSHVRPDGDAVGSLLALGLALQSAGKDVQMVLTDGVPSTFRYLPGSDQVRKRPEGNFDLIIVVDSSDSERVGEALDNYPKPDLNIDHHITNLDFAEINLVNHEAVATTEILTECLPQWGYPINQPIAINLLTGLITDTLGFRTSNMTPKALRVAATLVEIGELDLPNLYRKALLNRSYNAIRYWGAGLNKLKFEDRLVWTTLTMEERQEVNYPGRDDADLINVISTIEEAEIALIFIEQPNGNIKISWRAKPGFDVSQIALQFGGGGHKPAAGAELEGPLEDVQPIVLEATRALLNSSPVEMEGEKVSDIITP